jgi:hypothetical protein
MQCALHPTIRASKKSRMKLRHAAALALVVSAAAVSFLVWFSTRNSLLGRWKLVPKQGAIIQPSEVTEEIDFSPNTLTFVLHIHTGNILSTPATYAHNGNLYSVKRPNAPTLVFIANSDDIVFCGADRPDNNCFNNCELVPADWNATVSTWETRLRNVLRLNGN